MRTDWYKEIDPNLLKLTELLSMSKPSHGYTIAESAPEVVTAPGVYFPARKGEVIPLDKTAQTTTLNTEDELRFRNWYDTYSKQLGLNPNPDDPRHFYDYRGAYGAGAVPDETGHWPSQFKREGHPNLTINGVDTRTGIPTESRQAGGNVNPVMSPTSSGMMSNTEDSKMKILQSAIKSIDKIVASVSPKSPVSANAEIPLESRQGGGDVTSLLDRIDENPNVFTDASSTGAPNPEGDIQAGRSLDILSNAMRESNLAILQSPQLNLSTGVTSTNSSESPIPGLPSLPTSRSYGIQPEAAKLGGSDLINQRKSKKRAWHEEANIPLFSAQEGAITVPPEEDEYEKMRRLLGLGVSTPMKFGPPEPEGDRLAKERLGSTIDLTPVTKEGRTIYEDIARAKTEQADYDRYLADKELREVAGISPRRGMPEYETAAARMRMTKGEKFLAKQAEGKLAEQYITNKGLLDVAEARGAKTGTPHYLQNEKGEWVTYTPPTGLPPGVVPTGVKAPSKTVSSEELVRGDLRQRLGKEPSEGEILNEMDRRKLSIQMGGIPPLSPGVLSAPSTRGVKSEVALGGLTEEQKGIIRGLVDYKYPWPGSFAMRDPKWQALMGRAEMYDPDFNAREYQVRYNLRKSFTSGKDKDNILALNTAIGHIDSLVKAKDDLANSNWPTANEAVNLLAKYFPVSEGLIKRQGKITGIKTKFNAVIGEMANIFKRSGATDQEIKSWRGTIDNPTTATPTMWDAFISGSLELMGSRIGALRDRYESGMGKAKDFGLLSDKSRTILQGLGVDVDTMDSTSMGSASTPIKGGVQKIDLKSMSNEELLNALEK